MADFDIGALKSIALMMDRKIGRQALMVFMRLFRLLFVDCLVVMPLVLFLRRR